MALSPVLQVGLTLWPEWAVVCNPVLATQGVRILKREDGTAL